MSGPVDPDQIAALAREVERLARQQRAATDKANDIEQAIRNLHAAVQDLAKPPGAFPLVSWLWPPNPETGPEYGPGELDPEAAVEVLRDLVEWLDSVYLRYPDTALPSCWAYHPDVVEELLWLRGAHHDAYRGPRPSWELVGGWHERHRPGVVRRIRASAGRCELAQHRVSPRPPVVPLARWTSEVATTWALHAEPPAVDPDALQEAERYAVERQR